MDETARDTIKWMNAVYLKEFNKEDQLVEELSQLGITYLSNRSSFPSASPRSPEEIIADCVQQPSSRVRTAAIALFLLHPQLSARLPQALALLDDESRQLLKVFYTGAVYLQKLYYEELYPLVEKHWDWLPDFYGTELGLSSNHTPRKALQQLGRVHQVLTHSMTNWAGTYENAALHLIRYKQRELQWNQLLLKPSQPS